MPLDDFLEFDWEVGARTASRAKAAAVSAIQVVIEVLGQAVVNMVAPLFYGVYHVQVKVEVRRNGIFVMLKGHF